MLLLGTASSSAASGSAWIKRAPLLAAERDAAVAATGGRVYLIGGSTNAPAPLKEIQVCNPAANVWTKAAYALPSPRWGAAAASVGGRIIVIGGGSSDFDFTGTTTVYSIDPTAATVQAEAALPVPLEQAAAVPITLSGTQQVMVIGGDMNAKNTPTPVYLYNPVRNTWSREANLPVKNSFFDGGAVSVGGTVYFYGGEDDFVGGVLNTSVYRYIPATDTWTKVTTLPAGTDVTAQAAVGGDGRIYFVASDDKTERQTVIYDPVKNIWTRGPVIPTTHIPRTVTSLAGTVYAFGGGYFDTSGDLVISTDDWALSTTA